MLRAAHSPVAWRAYLELARPANVATALADVLAGFAVAGLAAPAALPGLLAATAGLYAGGVILPDVFDRDLDARERPERPIPSGRVPARSAAWLGAGLLLLGVLAAASTTMDAAFTAAAIAGCVVLYDVWGKHQPAIGPVNMGLCRGLNLLLGMAAVPGTIATFGPLAHLPLTYIAAVTALSRGEVLGGARATATGALAAVGTVLLALTVLSVTASSSVAAALIITALLGWRVVPALAAARRHPSPDAIRYAVRTGVLSLVLLDAVIAAAFAGMIYCLALLAAAVLAGRLARAFAVT
jgi:4-hydroxybenzoate polyprenyltransferase